MSENNTYVTVHVYKVCTVWVTDFRGIETSQKPNGRILARVDNDKHTPIARVVSDDNCLLLIVIIVSVRR